MPDPALTAHARRIRHELTARSLVVIADEPGAVDHAWRLAVVPAEPDADRRDHPDRARRSERDRVGPSMVWAIDEVGNFCKAKDTTNPR